MALVEKQNHAAVAIRRLVARIEGEPVETRVALSMILKHDMVVAVAEGPAASRLVDMMTEHGVRDTAIVPVDRSETQDASEN